MRIIIVWGCDFCILTVLQVWDCHVDSLRILTVWGCHFYVLIILTVWECHVEEFWQSGIIIFIFEQCLTVFTISTILTVLTILTVFSCHNFQSPLPDIAALESRQNRILGQLAELKAQVLNLCDVLKSNGEHTSNTRKTESCASQKIKRVNFL